MVDHDDLPALVRDAAMRQQFTEDIVRIGNFFWLVVQQWPPIMDVYPHVKQQKNDAACTRRHPLERARLTRVSAPHAVVWG